MPSTPYITEDAFMAFTTIVALVFVTVAFVAYVGTWIHARLEQRRAAREPSGCGDDRSDGASPRSELRIPRDPIHPLDR
jgi:hypothetical protein